MASDKNPLFNTSPEVGTKPAMGNAGWWIMASTCALLAVILGVYGGVQTPLLGHESIQPFVMIVFTLLAGGAILCVSRLLPTGSTAGTFVFAALVAILGLLGRPPEAIAFLFPWGWVTLLVFSIVTVFGHRRHLPE